MRKRLPISNGKSRAIGSLAIEYAALIAIAAIALLAMSAYFKGALCGRYRDTGDSFGYGRQYNPYDPQKTIVDEK